MLSHTIKLAYRRNLIKVIKKTTLPSHDETFHIAKSHFSEHCCRQSFSKTSLAEVRFLQGTFLRFHLVILQLESKYPPSHLGYLTSSITEFPIYCYGSLKKKKSGCSLTWQGIVSCFSQTLTWWPFCYSGYGVLDTRGPVVLF